jgi:hypothetical protein
LFIHRETEKQEEKAKMEEMQLEKRPKSKKAKAETLSEKVNKANIKNMKDHLYTPTAFFEIQRTLFVSPENSAFTFNNIVPAAEFPRDIESYRYNSNEYRVMRDKQGFDNYGILIKNAYLENVKYL